MLREIVLIAYAITNLATSSAYSADFYNGSADCRTSVAKLEITNLSPEELGIELERKVVLQELVGLFDFNEELQFDGVSNDRRGSALISNFFYKYPASDSWNVAVTIINNSPKYVYFAKGNTVYIPSRKMNLIAPADFRVDLRRNTVNLPQRNADLKRLTPYILDGVSTCKHSGSFRRSYYDGQFRRRQSVKQ